MDNYPMNDARKTNTNTWDALLYKESFDLRFIRDFESKLAINMITEFLPGNYGTKIERPVAVLNGAPTKDQVACTWSGTSSTATTIEVLERRNRYHDAYEYCPDNVKRTDVGIEAYVTEMDYKIKLRMQELMDKDAVDIAIANAGDTTAAVTDAATAQDALDFVSAKFSAFSDAEGITAIIPSTMLPFFRALGVTRITTYGDMFFRDGTLYDIFGIKLRVVDAARLTDPTKVLFVIGKPVKFYYDTMGFGINELDKPANIATGEYYNSSKIRSINIEGDFHVWSGDQKNIVVAG